MAKKVIFKSLNGESHEGVIGYRGADGSVTHTVRFCTNDLQRNNSKKLTKDEKDVCDGIVRCMADMFRKYVEDARALEQQD